jgi:predicted dienelactone hydrolase
MLSGYSRELFQLQEFIDRPLDVTYLLDELERRNKSEFQSKLNLKNVGAIGHSLGGYTVLALAGGKIDFDNLTKACHQTWSPNPSLLIQCRALDLPKQVYNLRDERIKAVIAVNPINSALFGSKGLSEITIPVFLIAGSQDPATPLVLEQGQAFNWLKTSDKYLGLVKGQAHINFSKLDAGTQTLIKSFADLTLPEQWLIDKYDNALMLAFFQVYLHQNEQYKLYLQASYADYISQKPFEFYLINSTSDQALKQVFNQLQLSF